MISYLCNISGVSRSGYYRYFSSATIEKRKSNEIKDLESKENILKAYNFKNRKKGAKQIKMTLKNNFNINYNLKRIRRIMKKYNIVCPHRKANPYRRMMKATKEHTVLPNLLNRKFKQESPGKVLLTDISYLFFKHGQKAYLSTILDASTNEILAYNISKSLKIDIVTDTIDKLIKNNSSLLRNDSFIHSDQGAHYTSPIFQKKVKTYNLGQSMSRRGNCWDNAPQESFFGHLKDETSIKECETFEELVKENQITFPLIERDIVFDIKMGKYSLEKVKEIIGTKLEEVEDLFSNYNKKTKDNEFINQIKHKNNENNEYL